MQNPKPSLFNPLAGPKKSLNREKRRRELVQITLENQAFLKRLQQKASTYSVEKWENEFGQQTKYRDQICEHPYEFGDGMPRGRLQTAQGGQRLGRFDYLTEGGMTNM